MGPVQNLGPEGLRSLHGHEFRAIKRGIDDQFASRISVCPLDGVDHGDGGNCCIGTSVDSGHYGRVQCCRSEGSGCIVHDDDCRLFVNHGKRASDRVGTFGTTDDECVGRAGRKQVFSGCFLTGSKHHHDVIGGGATGGERTIDDPFTTEHFVLLRMGSVAPTRAGCEHDRPDRTV